MKTERGREKRKKISGACQRRKNGEDCVWEEIFYRDNAEKKRIEEKLHKSLKDL